MDMVADRVIRTRAEHLAGEVDGSRTARTMGIASLGGATLDNEENYLIKKLFTGLGVVQIENQARVCHSSTVAGLGTSFGRGRCHHLHAGPAARRLHHHRGLQLRRGHPVGFQWVMEAKARGARVIHVDPRFTRTSALADLHVPIRAGTDVAFLGGIINHVLTEGKDFREFVLNYTNAATIVGEDFRDTEEFDGFFSGLEPEARHYETADWQYEGVEVASGVRQARARRRAVPSRWATYGRRRRGRTARRRAGRAMAGEPAARRDAGAPPMRVTRSSSGTTPATRPQMVSTDLWH